MRKEIPFTQGFTASESGDIHDADGNLREQYTNGDGYKTASVLTDDGKWVTFGVHRLVALAFKPPKTDHLTLTVNHIDGVRINNHPDNLEWISNRLNVVHGTLLNRYTNRPLIVCTKDDLLFWLNDLYDAANHFSSDIDTVWQKIRDGELLDGWKIEHVKGSDKRVALMMVQRPGELNHGLRPVKVLDLETNAVLDFESLAETARYFGVKTTHIRIRVSTPRYLKIFRMRWVIIDAEENFDFLTPEVIESLKSRGPKPIVCYSADTQSFETYPSAHHFLKVTPGLSKKAITVRLKKGELKPSNGWIVKVIEDLEEDKRKILEMARSLNLVK